MYRLNSIYFLCFSRCCIILLTGTESNAIPIRLKIIKSNLLLVQAMSQLARDCTAKSIEHLVLYLQQNKEKYGE